MEINAWSGSYFGSGFFGRVTTNQGHDPNLRDPHDDPNLIENVGKDSGNHLQSDQETYDFVASSLSASASASHLESSFFGGGI